VRVTAPLRLGVQEQARTIFGETPVVDLLIHPAILFPSARNIIFEAVETLTEIVIGTRYVAVTAPPLSEMVLKVPVDTNDVIVKSCVMGDAAA
jgi:hypothetical protein